MNSASVAFDVLTPCFCAGANQQEADIRAPSIRGQFRWWFRALGGTPAQEKALFGGVHGNFQESRDQRDRNVARASSVMVRVSGIAGERGCRNMPEMGFEVGRDPQAYLLWPLRPQRDDDRRRGVLLPAGGQPARFVLEVRHRGLQAASRLDRPVLLAFSLLGALGTRSRRGYGSIWPTRMTIDGVAVPVPDSLEDLRKSLEGTLGGAQVKVMTLTAGHTAAAEAHDRIAAFLQLFRCGSAKFGGRPSRWGQDDHDLGRALRERPAAGQASQRAALGLPLVQRYTTEPRITVETRHGDEPRWASPLLFKVIRLHGRFYPLALFARDMALPADEKVVVEDRRSNHGVRVSVSHDLLNAMVSPDAAVWKEQVTVLHDLRR
jgi:CRISPR/Cas system CMR-associated protein Cmr1 (group 7 of RAMP superfamily)